MQTATTRSRRKAPTASLPAYNLADGACTFRHGLTVRERAVMDQALGIVGRHLGELAAMHSVSAVKTYMTLHLGGEPSEHFGALYLDARHNAIAYERHFAGTLTQASVYPREIVTAAIRHRAAAVVLAHNHPSGSLQPSKADEAITQTLRAALSLIEVRVLDHIIVSGSKALSMAERGLL